MEGAPHRGYISTILGCKCPRCREGNLFQYPVSLKLRRNMEMYPRCPVCRQPTEIEVGFYYGTGYVSYVMALVMSGITFLLWFLLIGFSFNDNRFLWCVTFNSVMLLISQPWLMRVSRAFWLSCFVSYDPDWAHHEPEEPERINESQMNNW